MPLNNARKGRRVGFSLIELLVVVGIVAVLIALLVPALAKVRQAARATVCLSNLQQWGHAFQMYLGANGGRPFAKLSRADATELHWWESLSPYLDSVDALLVCPEAPERRDGSPDPGNGIRRRFKAGTATQAWRTATYQIGEPRWILRGDWRGSYGLNEWVAQGFGGSTIRHSSKQSSRVPMLADCCEAYVEPANNYSAPRNIQNPEREGLSKFCIDRHRMAVNVGFIDGHTERIALEKLWSLQWTENWVSKEHVEVPSSE